jgi:hypothetical protein
MPSRVYVIELSAEAGRRRDPRIPWVYVGSSAREPEIRFAQHRRGYKSSGLVKRFALRLRPDLYDDLKPLRRSADAPAAELARARELAACGFVAHSDGTSYGRDGGDWREWGAARLEPVRRHLEAAAGELVEAAFEPLDANHCARLLRGERGFWVADYIDPHDPPPAYGMFAHAELAALEARAANCPAFGPRGEPRSEQFRGAGAKARVRTGPPGGPPRPGPAGRSPR